MTDAATRALTPLAIVVLGLLRERPMHPYEMLRLMQQRRDDRLVGGSRGTLYHTVDRLERHGLITEAGVGREGNRPERTTYAISDAGAALADAWVRDNLARIDRILEFRVALSEAHVLPRADVIALLTARAAALRDHRGDVQATLASAHEREVPFQFLVELERELMMLDTDIRWVHGILTRLEDSALPWGPHELPAETRGRLAAFRESVLA